VATMVVRRIPIGAEPVGKVRTSECGPHCARVFKFFCWAGSGSLVREDGGYFSGLGRVGEGGMRI
jgi:hypothetical protein